MYLYGLHARHTLWPQTIQVIVDAGSSTAGSVFVQRRTVSDVDSAEYMFGGRNNVTKAYNKPCTVYICTVYIDNG